MTGQNPEYDARRAREEAAAARASASPGAASAHRLLAIEYEAQVRELRESRKPRLTLTPV